MKDNAAALLVNICLVFTTLCATYGVFLAARLVVPGTNADPFRTLHSLIVLSLMTALSGTAIFIVFITAAGIGVQLELDLDIMTGILAGTLIALCSVLFARYRLIKQTKPQGE